MRIDVLAVQMEIVWSKLESRCLKFKVLCLNLSSVISLEDCALKFEVLCFNLNSRRFNLNSRCFNLKSRRFNLKVKRCSAGANV